MKFLQVLVEIFILWQIWQCEASSSYSGRQANRKQKKLIEGSMNLKANPCDDFYEYACGKWNNLHLEAGEKYFEPISMFDYNVNKEMSRLLNRSSFLRHQPKFVQQVYNYYKSCKDLSKYESKQYLVWLKANDQFKWPSLWPPLRTNVKFDWLKTLAKMRKYGFNDVFVQQVVMSKQFDTKKYIIDLDKPVMDDGFKSITYSNLKVIIESVPLVMPESSLQILWKEIENFEEKLKKLDEIEDVDVENEEDFNKARLKQVKDLPLPWLKDYLQIVLNQTEISENMELYIQNIPYMMALDELIQQYDQRFLCRYLEIRFLWYLHQQRPRNFVAEDCISNVRGLMSTAMYWLYEQQHPELQHEYPVINEIFNNIRKHFNNTVHKNHHGFNASVIQYLQDKINNMKLRVNNIPRIDTVKTLERFYQELDLSSNQFYENHLELLKFNFNFRHQLLNPKKDSLDVTYLETSDTGTSSSPFFMQSSNTVFIPLTLLQHPIYYPELDNIYKYSSMGFLLAHEIFHGFDDSGLYVDSNGNTGFTQFDENPLFNASFNCIIGINPLVVSEKISDISGLRYSYQAFFDSNPEALNKTRLLHAGEMPLSKIFFLNFAQFFCGGSTPEEFAAMSDHGSDRERVMDALRHFPEFIKTFECTKKNLMYPDETCHLWRR